jgi:hypothetical protein
MNGEGRGQSTSMACFRDGHESLEKIACISTQNKEVHVELTSSFFFINMHGIAFSHVNNQDLYVILSCISYTCISMYKIRSLTYILRENFTSLLLGIDIDNR